VLAFEYTTGEDEVYQARESNEGRLNAKQLDLKVERQRAEGVVVVHGSFEADTLLLHADLVDWTPIPFVTFDGSLDAVVGLAATSLALDFDVHTSILGQRADFT